MAISANTFMSDSITFIRDLLASGLTDPISAKRSGRERFVMTAYPERPVEYPIITVKENGFNQIQQLGMKSEGTWINFPIEVRVWARNQKEKDFLSQQVYNYLRTLQENADGTILEGMYDFGMTSSANVDEIGQGNPKSRIMTFTFNEIITG